MKAQFSALVILVVSGSLVISTANAGDVTNTKLLLHATQSVTDSSNWQTASWVVVPNYTNPSKALVLAGLRYQQAKRWWVEANAGVLVIEHEELDQRERRTIFDLRASYDALGPIHLWTNVQHVPNKEYWYMYFEANYQLPFCLIGVETENDHPIGQDDLSIGPRFVLPFKKGSMVLIGSYQFHSQGEDQIWFRTVINF